MTPYVKEQWRASVSNGQIDRRKLRPITPTQFDPDLGGPAIMHPEAAAAMSALLAEAHAAGLTSLRVKYSYRTLAKQWEKWHNFQNGGNLAARPGTSNHGWAVSVDFTGLSEGSINWLRNNARRFGFSNDVPSEVWHWTYQGGWTPKEDDDVNLEKYVAGEKLYRERFKKRKGDPGPAPASRDKWFKAGWAAARFAAAHPKT